MLRVGFSPVWILPIVASLSCAPSTTTLSGKVTSAEGELLEGVTVSARAEGKTFTTSVYTDQNGGYHFPPLDSGHYEVWSQAVSFETARAELDVSADTRQQQDFTLRRLEDFSKQLSGTEWVDSLPEESPEDIRMKRVFLHVCANCHVSGILLQNRFDAHGWRVIVEYMEKTGSKGQYRGDMSPYAVIQAYKQELVEYLTRVRGPDSPPLKYKPLPRPTGEATQVVIIEYDIPPGHRPDYLLTHNGSDWSEGTPSKFEGGAAHDIVVDAEGNVWFTDTVSPKRTIGKLDTQTGQVTGYMLPDENNIAVRTHGIVLDQEGNVWTDDIVEGILIKFDPKTEEFQRFPRPRYLGRAGSQLRIDSKGNVWSPVVNGKGAIKLDAKTGEYTEYSLASENGGPYGIAVDANDNVWYSPLGANHVGLVDTSTGQVKKVDLGPQDIQLTEKDRNVPMPTGMLRWYATRLDRKGPRRIGADLNGNTLWIAEYWAGQLARIDINTEEVTEYPLPSPYSLPYAVDVDNNHMVWVSLMNSDRILKFNPSTEQFTEYPLPTLGTEIRDIYVDDRTDPPTVWIPYDRTNKIARVQFREPPA